MLIAGPAWADGALISPDDFSGMVDLRLSAANGEASWLGSGFGKTRVSGAGSGFAGHASIADSFLAWNPNLTWDLSAVIVGQYQSDHDHAPSLAEAYLVYKPQPLGEIHYSVRAGLFYPPVSQEHEGLAWIDTDMITPSAINSWVGEEVKVVGAEAKVRRDFGEQQLGVTAGVFGYNDTAGTLLATRGWALGDVRTGFPGHYVVPPLSDFLKHVQAPITTPVMEVDHRVGGYGRIDWRINDRLAVNAFFYDNAGDLTGDDRFQWAWDTRFWNLGAALDLGAHTRILSQVVIGDTRMGYGDPDIWVDTRFNAAYLLVTHAFGEDALSGRLDLFETLDRADEDYGDTRERGWALTADYRKRLSAHADLLLEALHVSSDRPARTDILGEPARQDQTVLQAALRLSF
jgi:hypothetical protein